MTFVIFRTKHHITIQEQGMMSTSATRKRYMKEHTSISQLEVNYEQEV